MNHYQTVKIFLIKTCKSRWGVGKYVYICSIWQHQRGCFFSLEICQLVHVTHMGFICSMWTGSMLQLSQCLEAPILLSSSWECIILQERLCIIDMNYNTAHFSVIKTREINSRDSCHV